MSLYRTVIWSDCTSHAARIAAGFRGLYSREGKGRVTQNVSLAYPASQLR